MILALFVGFFLGSPIVAGADDALPETTGGEAPLTATAPEPKEEPVAAAASEEAPPTTAAPDTTAETTPAAEPDLRPAGDVSMLAAPDPTTTTTLAPELDLDGDVVVTKRAGVNGCQGARPTPGSENTKKRLISGSVEPGESATFLIEYPVDVKDVGRETFEILDCVFINDVAVESYDISFVPNEEFFEFTYNLTVPVGAPIGALYCNVAKTTAAPSDSQASNRKAGPACFIIGGDLRVLKVHVGGPLIGAIFSVSCTPPTAPAGTTLSPVIIEGVVGNTMAPTQINGDAAISIAGPQGTVCTVTEVEPPPGYALPSPNFVVVTIGVDGPEIRFLNVLAGSPNLRIVKTADAAVVSAGSQIGFGINVANVGDATATAVTLSDPLPAGTGINWSLTPGYDGTCAITGAIGTQTLNCSFGDLIAGADVDVHVTSPTTAATVGTFRNVATAVATNHPPVDDDATVTVRQPILTIVKTADAASVSSGSPIGFGITVGNTGDGTATSVTLSDPLPAGTGLDWSVSPAYAGPGSCSIIGSPPAETLSCSFGNMAPGATATVHVTSPTTAATSGTFHNVATASSTNHADVRDDAEVIVSRPNLSIVKTADATSVSSGSPIGFGITVANAGPGTATAVTLSDPLPAGTGLDWSVSPAYAGPGSCSIIGSPPAETLSCSFGDMASGASATVHVTSATTAATSGTFHNVATASSTNHADVRDDAEVTVNKPNLSIVKTADATSVNSGSPIGFGITVANAGPGTATAVTLSDPLPAGTGLDWSVSPAYAGPGSCSIIGSPPAETLSCSFGDMASGATATVHVTSATTSATSGTFRNVAVASSTNHPAVEDDAVVTVNKPNLSVVKTAANPVVNAGSPIAFTISVTNAGPGTATAVTLNDPLPPAAGVTWTISPSREGCSISGTTPTQVLNCAFGDLASGVTAGVQVVSATTSATSGTLVNTATVTAGNHPPVVDDAEIVINRPGLSVAKVADATTVNSGSPIGFTVTVSNSGPGTATSVVLNDPLPSGTGINWSISPASAGCAITGAVGSQVLSCSFGDMAPTATASVHVVSATTSATSGTFINTATASASNHEPVVAIANVVVNKPNLSITKTADAASVTAGNSIGFTVAVTNAGPGAATNLTVSDPLPGGVDVSWSISPAATGCSITGTTTQTLTCTVASLAAGASLTVHVVSSTTVNSVGTFNNVATTQADNHPAVSANATTAVVAPPVVAGVVIERVAPALIAPPPPPAPAPVVVAAAPVELPRTGGDPLSLLFAGLLLIAAGMRFRRWGRRA